ncbi:MAG: VOC family protein [Paracoccaceae bacterium]
MAEAFQVSRISGVRIFSADASGSRQFYERVLGLKLTLDLGETLVFRVGETDLLVETEKEEPELIGRFIGVSLEVEDVDAAWGELSHASGVGVGAPETQSWGGRMAHVADPDGNILTLLQMPR